MDCDTKGIIGSSLSRHSYQYGLGYKITVADAKIQDKVREARRRRPDSRESLENPVPPYTREAFADALVEFFCSADLSFYSIENKRLRRLFLMLKQDLQETDIPHRQALRDRAIRMWEGYLSVLQSDLKVHFIVASFLYLASS